MELMKKFFQPTLEKMKQQIWAVMREPDVGEVSHLFLVGGFAESPLVQAAVRAEFSPQLAVVLPLSPGLAVLRGAVTQLVLL